MNEHNQGQTHYISLMVPNYFDIIRFSRTSSTLSFIIISILLLFEHISPSSSLSSLEETKLTVIVNWISHVSSFLRSFMISFKYGLILLRYCSTENFFFFQLHFYIQYNSYCKNVYYYRFIRKLFFILKKILSLKYSIFNCFSFFF